MSDVTPSVRGELLTTVSELDSRWAVVEKTAGKLINAAIQRSAFTKDEYIRRVGEAAEAHDDAIRAFGLQVLEEAHRERPHLEVDDCWYSCPKAENYCGETADDRCYCGADEANERAEEFKQRIAALGKETA